MNAATKTRPEVQSHPMVELVFQFARLPHGDLDVFFAEMPQLMQVICSVCSETPASASGVYYYLRNSREVTALDLIESKEHKVVTLSRLMVIMATHGILEPRVMRDAGLAKSYTAYQTAPDFRCEG